MKRDIAPNALERPVDQAKDPHEIFSDEIHYVVSRITPENIRRVLSVSKYDRSQSMPYVFFSQFSAADEDEPKSFFGQARRHAEFESAIQSQTSVDALMVRGQLQVDSKSGMFHLFSFFDIRNSEYFSRLSPKQLRTMVRKILRKIDHSLLGDQLLIQFNTHTYYIYFSRAKLLKKMKNASIGNMRYD